MTSNLMSMKEAYHKIVRHEYEKYRNIGRLESTFTTSEDISKLGIDKNTFKALLDNGFIIELGQNKYRSLLMDLAFRAADIRVKYGGTKYVMEYYLDLKAKPLLNLNYVKFDGRDDQNKYGLEELKKEFSKIIPKEHVEKFFKALAKSGIQGLSKYQYSSILRLLREKRDAVICAPTAFGKTYIFLIPILLFTIKNVIEGKNGTFVVLFYPRKSLGSDQMGRFIRLIKNINDELGIKITIGIDDGDVKYKTELERDEEYRGIRCPLHGEKLLIDRKGKVFCQKCGKDKPFEFIIATKEDLKSRPPNILITNIWAYQYKLCDPSYWRNGYLSNNIEFFVFDEIHAYRSIVAGILRYFIRILRSLVSKNARLILSSATIPKLEDFVHEISGLDRSNFINLVYNKNDHEIDEEKLELYLMLGVNPTTSWETYTHELAIFLSTVNEIKPKSNVQSLIFVDSIRNISRLYTQALEAIKLGDPEDHLRSDVPPEDPFCYWVYNRNYMLSDGQESKYGQLDVLRDRIKHGIETHYSDKADRFDIEERIKSGNVDVVFTTSTLELGVDYDNVMVVVNVGIPFSLESIVQRVGRAGRNEEKTLHTALCIVVIRNNPLEYFYIYKGIHKLTDIDKLPKIPVSSSNIFVVFYSALLYTLAYSAKEGVDFLGLKGPDRIKRLIEKFDSIRPQAIQELSIEVDISDMYEELKEIAEIISKPDIEEKLKDIKSLREEKWVLSQVDILIKEIEDCIPSIENNIDKLSEKEKQHFRKFINELKSMLNEWKKGELEIIEKHINVVCNKLSNLAFHYIKDFHPFHQIKYKLADLSNKLIKIEPHIKQILKTVKGQKISDKEFAMFYKIQEVYKNLLEHPVKFIESLVGFKFMGTEFIDQIVNIGVNVKGYERKGEKEEFLSNVMSRTPPFELITVPFEDKFQKEITNEVGARHFWLIKPEYFESRKDLNELEEKLILEGNAEKYKNLLIPSEIYYVDMLTLDKLYIIKIKCEDRKPLYIKYGSRRLATSKVLGKYPLHENIRRLYSLNPTDDLYEKIHTNTLKHLRRVDEAIKSSGNKWGLNFRYPFLCHLGYCVSVDPYDESCPVKDECDVSDCDGTKYWSGARRRRGIYPKRRIYPKFNTVLNVRNLLQITEPLVYDVGTKTFNELREGEEIEFVYDTVTVYLPVGFNDYVLREFRITPLGYLARTSFIYLTFNEEFLNTVLSVLLRDSDLLDLLKFKFHMFTEFKKKHSAIDAALGYENYNPAKINTQTGKFIEFVKESLLHTLAHLFLIYLITEKVPLDPERITYSVQNNAIYILENSKNDGIGLVETIKNELEKVGAKKFMDEFINWAEDYLKKHDEHVNKHMETLMNDAKSYLSKLENSKIFNEIKVLQEKIRELNQIISSRVKLDYIDAITYRHILSHKLFVERYGDEISEYILPIVHANGIPRLCVDGCEECLVFYRGCNKAFLQNYIISKALVSRFLNIIKKGQLALVGEGLGELLQNLMEKSEKIEIDVPYIDDYGLSILCELKKKGIDIEVITRSDNPKITELQKCGIKVRFSNSSHAKIYKLKKGKEVVCVHGSINLTHSSFFERKENMSIIWGDVAIHPYVSERESS